MANKQRQYTNKTFVPLGGASSSYVMTFGSCAPSQALRLVFASSYLEVVMELSTTGVELRPESLDNVIEKSRSIFPPLHAPDTPGM